jgi:hypothetical protein
VSADEAGSFEKRETVHPNEAVDWFAELGLPEPRPVPVLPLAHQVAQKLHACTSPDTETWANDRSHDLVDLQLAMEGAGGTDLREIRSAAERLFAARRLHAWPPTVTPRAGWDVTYRAQADGLDVRADLDDAIAWTNDLIRRIAGA